MLQRPPVRASEDDGAKATRERERRASPPFSVDWRVSAAGEAFAARRPSRNPRNQHNGARRRRAERGRGSVE